MATLQNMNALSETRTETQTDHSQDTGNAGDSLAAELGRVDHLDVPRWTVHNECRRVRGGRRPENIMRGRNSDVDIAKGVYGSHRRRSKELLGPRAVKNVMLANE
jgi:hypothetical protein